MTDIQNTEYITINKDGVFVGGKPAMTYHGERIYALDDIRADFAEIQRQNIKIEELHVGAFENIGFFAKNGSPSGVFGRNAWGRVKLFDGRLGPWVFCGANGSASDCANNCANSCVYYILLNSALRSSMLCFSEKCKQR